MGLHLIAFSLLDPSDLLGVLKVAVGLGLVIFVHELGHFAVAKACGVKCEKFYLGFDVFGLKLFKFRWGETEYGIGALPLGGYVKMLGQEDNPAKVREEMERARLQKAAAQQSGDAAEIAATAAAEAEAEAALYDPRSYLAKSVPKRMAIISAGVVMNVIFAIVFASIAYLHGVNEVRCEVGGLVPGFAAWRAGLQPGDKIVQIGDLENPRFKDLQRRVTLGDNLEDGVLFKVVRNSRGDSARTDTIDFTLVPERDRDRTLAPVIGISGPFTTALSDPPIAKSLVGEEVAAQFKPGDEVIKINDATVSKGPEIERLLVAHPGTVRLTILRADTENPETPPEQLTVELPARPMKTLGVAMDIGPVKAVQAGSPAALAGIQPGDVLIEVDGQPVGDPLFLPEQLRRLAGKPVALTVLRDKKPLIVELTPREPLEVELAGKGEPLTAPAIGVAYAVTNRIHEVMPDGPAAKTGISQGKTVTKAELILPKKERKWYQLFSGSNSETVELNDKKANWPYVFTKLQLLEPGTTVKLTLDDGESVTLDPRESHDWFNPERGLHFEPLYTFKKADSLGEAVKLGSIESVESVTQVYRFLGKLGTQVSPKAAGGPIIIAEQAFHSANQGISELLIFLTMLSANLAVINFLPIPLLDGGHMVFLIYEGIRGKPASERIVLAFHYAGFLFILSLMAFVFMLDLGIISRFGN